jgi:RNA 2',3'-cyclic 3'-phosphodiesterase
VSSPASVGGRERPRLFLAFPLPHDAVRRLAEWQRRELTGGRIVPPENLHVTVAFLGARPAGELDAIAGALRQAAGGADEKPVLTPERYRETRSVGMVVCSDEEGRATRIAEDVFERLERLEVYQRERRRWLPHITVLRFRERPRLDPPPPDLGPVRLSEAAVYISVLRPSGAQYDVLESVALGG